MAYAHTNSRGDTYYLHARDVALRSGKNQKIYYFSKMVQPGALHVLPSGKIVVENEKTGLPILKGSEEKSSIGTAEVMNGEKIKITDKKHKEAAANKKREEENEVVVVEETVWAESTNGVEETHAVITETEETNMNPEVSTRRKIKINPIALATLPAQFFLVATMKLTMIVWSKYNKGSQKPPAVEEEEL